MVETTKPSLARMYNFTLGGSQHIEADRDAIRQMRELAPELVDSFWSNHAFTHRAATLVAERGVRQFLDIGAGLLGDVTIHDLVRRVRPDAVVAYVDHDREAVEHGKRSLAGVPGTVFLHGDVRDPDLVRDPDVLSTLDPAEPIGVLMVGVLDFISDNDDPRKALRGLTEQLPPGSYLAATHITDDLMGPEQSALARQALACTPAAVHFRSREEVTRFFDGWEIRAPYPGARRDVSYVGLWGAEDPIEADDDPGRWWYAGIARKPAEPNGSSRIATAAEADGSVDSVRGMP